MENKKCQSCGIPLAKGVYGLNLDGTVNLEYCKLCFENGAFREPSLTPEDMMGRVMARLVDEQQMIQAEAEDEARRLIPTLKRWKI